MRRTRHLVSRALLSSIGMLTAWAAFAAMPSVPHADGSNRIYVTGVAGEVDVTMAGQKESVEVGTTVTLSARIVTGSNGSLAIQQSLTGISIAPNTDVEIPEAAIDGQLIARLVQRRGNVFYDVQQRDVGKLRVETPYLVAVVKGTQFNVAVQNDTATISLYEGSLQITTPDGADSVDIVAGEIAIRSGTDASIRVLSMNAAELPQPAAGRAEAAGAANGTNGAATGIATTAGLRTGNRADSGLDLAMDSAALTTDLRTSSLTGMTARDGLSIEPVVSAIGIGESITIDSDVGLDLGSGVAGLTGGIDLGSQAISAGLDAGLDLGGGSADIGLDAGLDLGAGSANIGLDAGLDLAAGSADIGLDTGLDLGAASADIGLDTGLDLGAGSADIGLDTGLDLGAGSADIGLDTGLDLGAGSADIGLDTGLDLGAGTADVDLDTGLDLGGAGADVGLDAGLDLGAGGGVGLDTGVDLDVGGLGLDADVSLGDEGLDVDLGLGGGDDSGTLEVVPEVIPEVLDQLGGLLGGIL